MSAMPKPSPAPVRLPDHMQLPCKDNEPVRNYQEPPLSTLLTDALGPVLRRLFPDGDYCLGRDMGIYFRLTDPPQAGCKAPDWYLVPNVPSLLAGELRRSYVLWQELVAPLIAIEYAIGNAAEERDRTPLTGKFWVYERAIRIPYYAIFEWETSRLEVYQLLGGRYQLMTPNERGHYPIEPLSVELGVWHGQAENVVADWLRWWDGEGNLLSTSGERARQAEERNERLAARLRALGVDPDNGDAGQPAANGQ